MNTVLSRLRGQGGYLNSWQELEDLVLEIGFLPLFSASCPGFSAEDYTLPGSWFTGEESDPWEWRQFLARNGKVAYGKFFGGKAGFISREWFPRFANYRRDGYDFDARWDDELASIRSKKIMDLFAEELRDRELFSYEVKELAGFSKNGEKNFEGEITKLQMLTYLCVRDFRQRTRKDGKAYGWSIGILCTPEHLFGEDYVKSAYKEDPKESWKAIYERASSLFPDHPSELKKLLGIRQEVSGTGRGSLPYPANLVKALRLPDLSYDEMDPGQRLGLTVALSQLQTKHQRVFTYKYREGKSNDEIAALLHKSPGTIGTYHGKAMSRLKLEDLTPWYREGFNQMLVKVLQAQRKPIGRLYRPEEGLTKWDSCLAIGLHLKHFSSLTDAGIFTIQELKDLMEEREDWYKSLPGIGKTYAGIIKERMEQVYKSLEDN